MLEVEAAGGLLHLLVQLGHARLDLGGGLERLLGGLRQLDRDVVALVDGLEQLADRRADGLRGDPVLGVIGGLERAAPLGLEASGRARLARS